MRLIDADEIDNKAVPMDSYDGFWSGTAVKLSVIRKSPTIDAVPVVRCKDCKYHEDEEIGMVYCPNALGGWVAENWFCADGERKEGQA